MQFALCLPGFEQATQPFAIVADQGLGHALRESLARSLQLPEQHSRHTGMIRHEIDMRHEDRLKGSGRRCGFFRCLVHRSEEHTSELQSLMRISYAVFCLKKKN